MNAYISTILISFGIAVLFSYFRKTFEKISWKSLVILLVLSRIPDVIGTILCLKGFDQDYSVEENIVTRWMLANFNLSDTATLIIQNVIIILLICLFFKLLAWDYPVKPKLVKTLVRILLLTFTLEGIIFSVYHLRILNILS